MYLIFFTGTTWWMWRKICLVEKNLSCRESCPHGKSEGTNLISHKLLCFVTKSVLSRLMCFCMEKNWTKNCVCGEKITNFRCFTRWQRVQKWAAAKPKTNIAAENILNCFAPLKCTEFLLKCNSSESFLGHFLPFVRSQKSSMVLFIFACPAVW